MSLTDDLDACQQELIGGVLRNMDAQAWLQLMQLLLNLQNHIGQLVGGAVALTIHTTDVDIREVIISARLQGRHTYLRRCRLVVELDPQARDEFLGFLTSERTILQTFLIEGEQMLIDVSWVHGVPAVQFRHGAEVYEPIHLNGFPQIAGRMGRHPVTHVGNLL